MIRRRYCTGPGTSYSLYKGAPHPLAALRMTAAEWETEQRLQRAVESTAIAVAQAAVAGAVRIDLTGDGVDVELIAHRVGNLGVRLRTEATTVIELVGGRWMPRLVTGRLPGWTTGTPPPERRRGSASEACRSTTAAPRGGLRSLTCT